VNSKLTEKKLRIDVGTSINAPVSRYWFSRLSDIFVIGIEPNPGCLRGENLWNGRTWSIENEFNNHPQSDNYYHVVGACDNVETLQHKAFHVLDGNVGCSSLLTPKIQNIHGCSIEKVIDVETFSLKMMLDNISYENIELIKIDAQGKDLDIVKGLNEHIERVQYIDMEDDSRYQYENASSRDEMIQYMQSRNFTMYEIVSGNLRFCNNTKLGNSFSNFTGDM
jgi:FkbM family methyltransferase